MIKNTVTDKLTWIKSVIQRTSTIEKTPNHKPCMNDNMNITVAPLTGNPWSIVPPPSGCFMNYF